MLRIILYKNTELQSEWDVVKGCNSYIRSVFKVVPEANLTISDYLNF